MWPESPDERDSGHPVPPLRHQAGPQRGVVVAEATECRRVGASGRAAEQDDRVRRLTPEILDCDPIARLNAVAAGRRGGVRREARDGAGGAAGRQYGRRASVAPPEGAWFTAAACRPKPGFNSRPPRAPTPSQGPSVADPMLDDPSHPQPIPLTLLEDRAPRRNAGGPADLPRRPGARDRGPVDGASAVCAHPRPAGRGRLPSAVRCARVREPTSPARGPPAAGGAGRAGPRT